MSVESKRRHGSRNEKIFIRQGRERQIIERLEEELEMFHAGEPSEAFYPSQVEVPEVSRHVLFDASKTEPKGRKGDLAKRRKVVINTLLEEPQSFPETKENLSFVKRHFGRIYKFAITLRNKRRLHPQIQEILDL